MTGWRAGGASTYDSEHLEEYVKSVTPASEYQKQLNKQTSTVTMPAAAAAAERGKPNIESSKDFGSLKLLGDPTMIMAGFQAESGLWH